MFELNQKSKDWKKSRHCSCVCASVEQVKFACIYFSDYLLVIFFPVFSKQHSRLYHMFIPFF